MERTKRAALYSLAFVGGWAVFGTLYEEGGELAEKGFNRWVDSPITGTNGLVLMLSLLSLLVVGGVAIWDLLDKRAERKKEAQRFVAQWDFQDQHGRWPEDDEIN